MIIEPEGIEFCLKCKNENPSTREMCDCGSRTFVFGDNFTIDDECVICDCGNKEFSFVTHINMSPIHNKNYQCTCGNIIGVQTYCEE